VTEGIETAPVERPIQSLDADELAFLNDALSGYRAEYGFGWWPRSVNRSVQAAS
jgi:hypothetical protein